MCPAVLVGVEKPEEKRTKQTETRGVPVEVIANGVYSRLNQPSQIKVNDDGSLFVRFGKRQAPDDKQSRYYQFYFLLRNPGMKKQELVALVEAWYQLRFSDECKRDFHRVNDQILDLISQPARAEEKDSGYILSPIEPGTKIEATLIVYTTFESDKSFALPGDVIGKPLHGKFNEDGHVVAFVTEINRELTFVNRNGVKLETKVSTPDED